MKLILKNLLLILAILLYVDSHNNIESFFLSPIHKYFFPVFNFSNKYPLENVEKMVNTDTNYSLRRTSSKSCSEIYNIYNCFSTNDCYWCNTSKRCYDINSVNIPCEINMYYRPNPETTSDWIFNQIYLTPRISSCGVEYYDIYSTNEINIQMEGNLELNQGCHWEFENKYNLPFVLNIQRQGQGKDKLIFADFNNYNEYELVQDNQISIDFKKEENLMYKFIIYKSLTEKANSFKISIKTQNPGISISKIVTIILLIAGGVILILSGGILIYKFCIKPQQDQGDHQQNGRPREIINPGEVFKQLKETNMEECRKYDQLTCTICLLPHDQQAAIVELPCHHYFHSNCIKSWIYKKNSKPSCPNCNYDLLSHKIIPLPQNPIIEDARLAIPASDSSSNQNEKQESLPQDLPKENKKENSIEPSLNKCNVREQNELSNSSNLHNLQMQKTKDEHKKD